ncbi:DUF6585 family protein [Embleya scabrispora]|uniref:DUF6585 family protein n=1 Tax=Embleya scabrispora TaxID=159449 RepID=UPI00039FCEDC|nr:DUF6585 family protein [Embleya scabrispora]MYS86695.1 hypothetical protein [Streptomyces sp. SID5474]
MPDKFRALFVVGSLAGVASLVTGGVLLGVFVAWWVAFYPLLISAMASAVLLESPNFRRRLGGRRLHLFEKGLLVDRGAGRLFAVRWDQAIHYQATVREVIDYKGTKTSVSNAHTSTLVAPDGAKVHVSDFFADFGTWAPLITEAIARAQVQQMWEAVRAGRRAGYGPFDLDATGITAKRKGTLPWSAVETIDVRGGFVVVRQREEPKAWALTKVKTVPNLLVFLTIASNLHGG